MDPIKFPSKLKFLFRPARYKVAYGGRGGTKCFGLGTRILMFDGTIKAVEDVAVGDSVMGPDSKPRTVLTTTSGVSKLYRISQTSAIDYVVNEDHILSLKKSKSCQKDTGGIMPSGNLRRGRGRYPDWSEIVNISMNEYLNQSNRWKEHFRGYRAGLIKFNKQKVPVDPYLLGVWLGDGLHRELMITSADKEVAKWLKSYSDENGLKFTIGGKAGNKAGDYRLGRNPEKHVCACQAGSCRINPAWQGFEKLGIVSNKHIPQSYISNAQSTRLKLLAGLIDSDGTYKQHGYIITSANERLAKGIKQLADSLGFRTTIKKIKTACGDYRGIAWRVGINGNVWEIPCLIERKKYKKNGIKPNKDKTLSYISVKSIGKGKYAGFSVDSDHLFCLEDGTVVHNSWGFARALLLKGVHTKLRILCAREVQNSIKDSVHKLLKDQIQLIGLGRKYEVFDQEIRGANGTEFLFTGLSSLTVESIKSFEGCDIVWVEEGQTISDRSWKILIPTIRKERFTKESFELYKNLVKSEAGQVRIRREIRESRPEVGEASIIQALMSGIETDEVKVVAVEPSEIWVSFNPNLETDPTYDRFVVNTPPDAVVVKVNWRDSPFFNQTLESERLHCQRTDPEGYRNIWEGECLAAVEGAIFFREMATMQREQRIRNVPYDPMLKAHVVLDLGYSSGGKLGVAIVQKHTSEVRVIRYEEFDQVKLSTIAVDLKELRYNWGKVWLPKADGFSKTSKGQRSAEKIFKSLGWTVASKNEVSPKTGVEEGLTTTREVFPRMYWDAQNCKRLIECAGRYRRVINKMTLQAGAPLGDEFAHGGDVIRYICINVDQMRNDVDDYDNFVPGQGYEPYDEAVGY